MGHSDNLNSGLGDPVNYPVAETPEEKSPRTPQMHGPLLRTALDLTDGVIEFRDESIPSRATAFGILGVGSLCFSDRVRMESNAWSGHRIVRGSGAVPRTTESSLLSPGRDHRFAAQSLHPTPIQHHHRLSHAGFQANDRQAREAPRWEDAAGLSRLYRDCASCLQINRRIGFHQSICRPFRLTASC